MAIGKASDFKIYHEYFDLGFTETIAQKVDVFNANSNGAIVLSSNMRKGDYAYSSYFEEISGLDSRRDTTSVNSVTPLALTQDELVSVKLNRKQGPVQQTVDAFKKKGMTPEVMSMVLGQQSAKALNQAYLTRALSAAVAAITGVSNGALVHDATDGSLALTDLTYGMEKFRDNFNGFAAMVMHHAKFFDIFRDEITNFKIENVAGARIATGGPAAVFGLPIIVTADNALVNADGITAGTDSYYTLLLAGGAVSIEESEDMTLHTDTKGGLENLVVEWQLEYAFNLGVKGFKWDVANGGANPQDAAIATSTNWDQAFTDTRNLAGVVIESA